MCVVSSDLAGECDDLKNLEEESWDLLPQVFSALAELWKPLKTWERVLWADKGEEISVMWVLALLPHKSFTTSLFLAILGIVFVLDHPVGEPNPWRKQL